MSGETERDVSGFTVETLRVLVMQMFADRDRAATERTTHFQQMIDDRDRLSSDRLTSLQAAHASAISDQEQRTQQALSASDRAIGKAETATEKRFDGVNEFRKALADQASTFPSRTEVDARFTAMQEKVDTNASRMSLMMTRTEIEAMFNGVAAQATTRNQLLLDKSESQGTRLDRAEGSGTGKKDFWGYIVAGVSMALLVMKTLWDMAHTAGVHP